VKRLLFVLTLATPLLAAQAVPPIVDSAALNRKVELTLRRSFDIPTACDVHIGARTSSQFPGYDTLRITLSQGQVAKEVEFLISKDDATLVRLDKFDLNHNPALAIDVHGRPVRGDADAAVTVINFDDLECPVCARMHQILTSELAARYGAQIRFIYKDNPLTEIHPWAMHAAVDAGCLAQQDGDAYWSFVDYVHTHGEEVSGSRRDVQTSFANLDQIAIRSGKSPGIDQPILLACLRKQDETPVRQSMKEAQDLGLNFTPALFVNGEEVRGLTSQDDPDTAVVRALRNARTTATLPALQKPGK
jgi:protein-disulfide isomerase